MRRRTGLTLAAALALASAAPAGATDRPFRLSQDHADGRPFMGVRPLGARHLTHLETGGLRARELSGLAWDDDEQVLYAVSDGGYLVHLEPRFDPAGLAGVSLAGIFPLLDENGGRLPRERADAEGLHARHARNGVSGDAELVISFERTPRIARYTPRGKPLGAIALPPPLSAIEHYAHPNKALEAVTEHPRYGVLTAPERPLRNHGTNAIPVYAMNGRSWPYRPFDPVHGALVGMETMPGGDLLILERRYVSALVPVIISLTRMRLETEDPLRDPALTEVARFDSSKGWAIDNFEGIAHHTGSRYFLVSDDNHNAIQKTLLFYFEVLDEAASGAPARF